MAPLEARRTLQTLVQGFDPVSGAELPAATPLHHAEVIQALLTAIGALDEHAARTRRRAQLPRNVGRPWTPPEEEQLRAAFSRGEPPAAIAARHYRTLAAIEARLESLGLMAPAERTTRNRYVSTRSA